MYLNTVQSFQLDILFITLCYLPGYALLAISCSSKGEKMMTIMAIAYGAMLIPLQITEHLSPARYPVWVVSLLAGLVCIWHLAGYLIIAATAHFRYMLKQVFLTGTFSTLLAAVTHLTLRLMSNTPMS